MNQRVKMVLQPGIGFVLDTNKNKLPRIKGPCQVFDEGLREGNLVI